MQAIKIVVDDAESSKRIHEAIKNLEDSDEDSDGEFVSEEPDDEWEIWLLLKFGEDTVSMEHLDAVPAAVLWTLRAFVDKIDQIDKIDEDEDMPVREMPVGCVQVGLCTSADSIALRRIRAAQRVGLSILPADLFKAVALAQLGRLVAEATGVGTILISSTSLAVLRLAVEERLVQLLEEANLAAIHAHRFCVRPTDLRFVIQTQGTCLAPGTLPADAATDAMFVAASRNAEEDSDDESDGALNPPWSDEEEEDDSSAEDDLNLGSNVSGGGADQEDRASAAVLRELMAANSNLTESVVSASCGSGGATSSEWGDWALPRKAFEDAVRSRCIEIFGRLWDGTQFQSPAVFAAMQLSLEAKMHTIMQGAAMSARHAGRTLIFPNDVQLARRLHRLRA
jgi:histone H3/H4